MLLKINYPGDKCTTAVTLRFDSCIDLLRDISREIP